MTRRCARMLDAHVANLGYALLLKRYRARHRERDRRTDPRRRCTAPFPTCRCCSGRSASWSGSGFWFIALFAAAFWLSARQRLDRYRWFLRVAFWSLPLPWIAAELGWIVAEYGRQPWVIEGVLPTALGVSSTDAGNVLFSLLGFALFYSALLVVDLYLLMKYIRLGPDAAPCARGSGVTPMIDYETLRLIWWALLGILLIGFAVMDGFDLGTAALLPFVARTDMERRIAINTVGPVWEGNQVWFILGGGAIFAAWPALYAASFSGFYLAMFLVLATLILRPVGFKFRSKLEAPLWRSFWDWALFAGGVVPVAGVRRGVRQSVPRRAVQLRRRSALSFHHHAVLAAQSVCAAGGAGEPFDDRAAWRGWLNLKTEGSVQARARAIVPFAALVFAVLFALAGFWLTRLDGYQIVSAIAHDGPSNPAQECCAFGRRLDRQLHNPWLWLPVAMAFFGAARRSALAQTSDGRVSVLGAGAGRHHRHGGRGAVSVPAAVVDRSGCEPDGVGCVVQQAYARDHAGRGGDLPADHSGLYRLGLSRAARAGARGRRDAKFQDSLLGDSDVVFFLGSGLGLRGDAGGAERHVARAPRRSQRLS